MRCTLRNCIRRTAHGMWIATCGWHWRGIVPQGRHDVAWRREPQDSDRIATFVVSARGTTDAAQCLSPLTGLLGLRYCGLQGLALPGYILGCYAASRRARVDMYWRNSTDCNRRVAQSSRHIPYAVPGWSVKRKGGFRVFECEANGQDGRRHMECACYFASRAKPARV